MNSSFTRNDWIQRVEAVLDTKKFPPKERNFLTSAFLYFYDSYRPTSFCNLSKEEYCRMYLSALQKTEEFRLFPPSSINEDSLEALVFRNAMVETNHGNFQKTASGLFAVDEQGKYICVCDGVALGGKKVVCMDLQDELKKYRTCHHELTHVLQGRYAFCVPAKYPFALEFTKMCAEGDAVSYEPTLGSRSETVDDLLCTKEMNYLISDYVPYPLYHTLYSALGKWIGKDALEALRNNKDSKRDPFELVREYAPNCPIEELYVNMINILQYYDERKIEYCEDKVEALKGGIFVYRRHAKVEEETLQRNLRGLEGNKDYFKQCKEEQTEIRKVLDDPQLLEKQFLLEKEKLLREIEEDYQQQRLDEIGYQEEKKDIETQATLECYRASLVGRESSLQTEMTEMEQEIQEGLQTVKEILSHQQTRKRFDLALKKVFDHHLTLQDSFTFLQTGEYPKKKQDVDSRIDQMVQDTLSSKEGPRKSSMENK